MCEEKDWHCVYLFDTENKPKKDDKTIEVKVSFDSEKAINKVKEIEQNGGTYEEAVEEVKKIINETTKVSFN
jgi:hypothetical protein